MGGDLAQQQTSGDSDANAEGGTSSDSFKAAKRTSVAVTGGVVTAVGLVLIPAPIPFGCVVAAYGVSILATEFDGVEDALANGKEKLQDGLKVLAERLQENDEAVASYSTIISDDDEEMDKLLDEKHHGAEQLPEKSSSKLLLCDQQQVALVSIQQAQQEVAEAEGEVQVHVVRGRYEEFKQVLTGQQDVVQKAKGVWKIHANNMRRVSIHVVNEVLLPALRNVNFPKAKAEFDESERTEVTVDETYSSSRRNSDVPGSAESVLSKSTHREEEEDEEEEEDDDSLAQALLHGKDGEATP